MEFRAHCRACIKPNNAHILLLFISANVQAGCSAFYFWKMVPTCALHACSIQNRLVCHFPNFSWSSIQGRGKNEWRKHDFVTLCLPSFLNQLWYDGSDGSSSDSRDVKRLQRGRVLQKPTQSFLLLCCGFIDGAVVVVSSTSVADVAVVSSSP